MIAVILVQETINLVPVLVFPWASRGYLYQVIMYRLTKRDLMYHHIHRKFTLIVLTVSVSPLQQCPHGLEPYIPGISKPHGE
jgi:hypothetical protein